MAKGQPFIKFGKNAVSTGVNSYQGMKDAVSGIFGEDGEGSEGDAKPGRRAPRMGRKAGAWANHLD